MLTVFMQAIKANDTHDLVNVLQEMVDSLYPHYFQKLKFNDHLVSVVCFHLMLVCHRQY